MTFFGKINDGKNHPVTPVAARPEHGSCPKAKLSPTSASSERGADFGYLLQSHSLWSTPNPAEASQADFGGEFSESAILSARKSFFGPSSYSSADTTVQPPLAQRGEPGIREGSQKVAASQPRGPRISITTVCRLVLTLPGLCCRGEPRASPPRSCLQQSHLQRTPPRRPDRPLLSKSSAPR